MKPKIIISFAAGLILAASVSGAVFYAEPNKGTRQTDATTEIPSEEEMKDLLASAGYVIHTEEEWKEQLATVEAVETKEEAVKDVKKETVIYRTMLTVSQGMTSIDVGRALQQANIIDNALDFFKEVEKRGLANDLRPGTYEIDSEMTLDKIMSTVFK
ncbi:hypothetical protein PY093_18020 [Cytobacillus sp. S13-E01]|uniref:hypothetical protein n=1 Tax=Cytobacillus sp. S13-E01 TaxID=3031326 RepID=UPI0023D85099|nr:hypothetical protein [Cytobacillus sp. S13-E01]MDF0728534.1 hypothetical protein [Cytobacillus sp. S13-E01]